jgi:AcrR family transcriptional regulator
VGAMTNVFWQQGFAATSLDDIALATRMNRPSLYAAFGDKRAMYLLALEAFAARAVAGMAAELLMAAAQPFKTLVCLTVSSISVIISTFA